MSRLLILACSQRKRLDVSLLPAIDRYDGPAFRVLRRYRRARQDSGLVIYILSAQFGLISADSAIPAYDRQMTAKRADELRRFASTAAARAIGRHRASDVFVCAGKTYLRALNNLRGHAPSLTIASGGQGRKLTSLKAWLHER